jgi:4a-hydroxytetrahydrobiopterin dehydratase
MTNLAAKHCVPCRGGQPPLPAPQAEALLQDLGHGWKTVENHHLEKEYTFKDFREALDFVVRVGELAEEENHHPDIYLAWGRVRLTIWTHKIDGLTESDFVFAAKAEALRV